MVSNLSLKKEFLPENTRNVFDYLANEPLLRNFTLIGGTALSLQIGHRLSGDLDFWTANETLKKHEISMVIRNAQNNKFNAELAMSNNKIIAAKINGIDVLLYSQDYKINNVKVTFFARKDEPYQYFDGFDRIKHQDTSFSIMAEEGLLAMKSYVIHQRTRSRDIFDLYFLLKNGGLIEDILDYGKKADPSSSIECAKAVLMGLIPLDEDDEGLVSIGELTPMTDIYDFFKRKIDDYEIAIAAQVKIDIQKSEENSGSDDVEPYNSSFSPD